MPTPTLGRIVLYRLSDQDASDINRRRKDAQDANPGAERTGVIVHHGNPAAEGQVCPAQVVRIFEPSDAVNLQVALDGNDHYWATSRTQGTDPGHWAWPEVK
ncbi:hypothetical protein [Actinacidiphila sp. ITFR-21]|uniref:hypothetical protein n=1 Tax=Actinacidiphila sp. ITFR-21 TaxID=3075199 RepID=UPI00288C059B|nr:hypothetical protein [Streptomyces sp. ITFR-21]WNI17572.1 hypothetical protein RLT57_19990 [Streptomyces sp. ITFR-21]WNI17712.1 hypothetical protein RLT57_20705 [Streptomyces sp. ITFR-21]